MPKELTYTLAERRKLLELARDAERAKDGRGGFCPTETRCTRECS
jgi:hypothetical protein